MTPPANTEIKIVIPYWMMFFVIAGLFFQGTTTLLLVRQRYQSDLEFLAKVKEIQKQNADLRAHLEGNRQ